MRILLVALPVVATLSAVAPLHAQQLYSGCIDRIGRPVTTIPAPALPSAGTATVVDGRPVIYWNPQAMRGASETARTFIYLHECAHHMLGHLYRPNDLRWETEADCWAIQHMVEGGAMHGRDVVALEEELARWPGDATHLGGARLVQSLNGCLDAKTDRRLWSAALDRLMEASRDSFASIRRAPIAGADTIPTYEAAVGPPGTYDCVIKPRGTLLCPLFDGRAERAATARFRAIARILRDWMGNRWTIVERDSALPELHAMDHAADAQISLVATEHHQIYFIFEPGSR